MNVHRRMLASIALGIVPGILLGACGGAPVNTPAPGPAPARAATVSGSTGDTAAFGLKLLSVAYSPDVITYELKRPSYVTILSVTQTAIASIVPRMDVTSQIEMAGVHLAGLTILSGDPKVRGARPASSFAAPLLSDDATVGDVQAYNRCMAEAAAMSKRDEEASRRVIGRDSAGRPIYGPPTVVPNERNYEARCDQSRKTPRPTGPTSPASAPRQAGRFLLVFASDTPVEHKHVLALAITESEPRLMTAAIGRKLFAGRDAIWSGVYRSW